jgi:NAD(P)-dependent dehydrogenase (short-subunit alcohol dehydrogenase family)
MTMPQLTFELPDTVVVTGASSGLGHELCSLLVEAGVATVGVDLAAAQDNLAALAGYRHVAGDVAGEATWEKVVARLRSSGAKRIGLVTSAAILSGVRANVLSPGPMLAGLFKRHLESATDSDKFLATRSARQPGGRILEAREVAQAAMFLLSSGSTAVLGADLVADGGLTASFDFRTGEERASI